jgi:hypothetical protein
VKLVPECQRCTTNQTTGAACEHPSGHIALKAGASTAPKMHPHRTLQRSSTVCVCGAYTQPACQQEHASLHATADMSRYTAPCCRRGTPVLQTHCIGARLRHYTGGSHTGCSSSWTRRTRCVFLPADRLGWQLPACAAAERLLVPAEGGQTSPTVYAIHWWRRWWCCVAPVWVTTVACHCGTCKTHSFLPYSQK